MKKKILGMLLVLSVALNVAVISAVAYSNRELVQAWLCRDVQMQWNGQQFTAVDDTTGETIYPIIYNNRTYIPARYIAEKAGVTVGWDGNNQTVQFGTNGYTYESTTPATPSTPSSGNEFSNPNSELIDVNFIANCLNNAGLVMDSYTETLLSDGVWKGRSYGDNGTAWPEITFKTPDIYDRTRVSNAFAGIEQELKWRGFSLVGTDSHGAQYYSNGVYEIKLWDITGNGYSLGISMATGIHRIYS